MRAVRWPIGGRSRSPWKGCVVASEASATLGGTVWNGGEWLAVDSRAASRGYGRARDPQVASAHHRARELRSVLIPDGLWSCHLSVNGRRVAAGAV